MKKPAFIFDFDGTIADSLNMGIDLYNNHIAEKLKIKKIALEKVEELKGKNTYKLLNEHNINLIKLPILLYRAKKLMGQRMAEIDIFDGMKEVFFELHNLGFKIGVLTSNNKANVESFFKYHNLETFFDFIYSEKNIFGKDKAIKNLMKIEKLNKIIYVGDETRDIEACKKVGVPIISVGWGFNTNENLKKHKPEYFVNHPSEIVEIAKNILK